MAVTALLKLAGYTNDLRYVDIPHQALAQMQGMMSQYPLGFGQWLQALACALSKPPEIAIVGDPDSPDAQALLDAAPSGHWPFQVVALKAPDAQPPAVPLLRDRSLVVGHAQYSGPAAYVCRDFACQPPATEPERLQAQLTQR